MPSECWFGRGVPGDDTVVDDLNDLARIYDVVSTSTRRLAPEVRRDVPRRPLARAHRGVDDHAPDGLIAPCRRVRSRAEIDRARGAG